MRKKPITSVALLPEDKARLEALARKMSANNSEVITHLLRRACPEIPQPNLPQERKETPDV